MIVKFVSFCWLAAANIRSRALPQELVCQPAKSRGFPSPWSKLFGDGGSAPFPLRSVSRASPLWNENGCVHRTHLQLCATLGAGPSPLQTYKPLACDGMRSSYG